MKKVLFAFCVATLAGTVAAAQSGAGAPGQAKPSDAGAAITVTGCVAAGPADQFQLTNATMGSAAAEKDKPSADKPKLGLATYNLAGGTNLKAHVGHKVEVTGSIAKPDAAAAKPAGADAPRGTLNVSNVKMVSSTCP